jgi:hypothetical protein
MNNPDHIFKSLKTIFLVSLTWSLDPEGKKFGSGMEKSRIRDKHPGSATLIVIVQTFLLIFLRAKT